MFPRPLYSGRWRFNRKLDIWFLSYSNSLDWLYVTTPNPFFELEACPDNLEHFTVGGVSTHPSLCASTMVCVIQPESSLKESFLYGNGGALLRLGLPHGRGWVFFLNDESWRFSRIFGGCWLLVDRLISTKRHQFFWCERWWTRSNFFWGGCRFGVKNGLRHWVGEKGRGGAETWWECATVRPEFVDVPSPESSERYPLPREPLSSNEAVPICFVSL